MTQILRPGIPVFKKGKSYILRNGMEVEYTSSLANRRGFSTPPFEVWPNQPHSHILVTDLDGKCVDYEIPQIFWRDFDVVGEA